MATGKPFKKTMLGVSLIHGQFRALAVVKGQTVGTWVCPDPIETFDDLGPVLAEAIRATNFPGKRVGFLVEDLSCVHQYHLVPPMKTADLEVYLERMAAQEKVCEGPGVWRYRKAQAGRGRTGFLLDVWPKDHVDHLVRACQEQNLNPIQMFPLSAVFVDQVLTVGAEPEEVVLLITRAWDRVVFVVATGDGKPLFDRFLMSSDEAGLDHERIGREVTRSLLFTTQQLGQRVSQVWVMGEGDQLTAEGLQPHVTVPVIPSPILPDPAYWIWVSLTLAANHPSNFIPLEVRKAPQRRIMRKVSAGVMVGLACLSISTTGVIEGIIDQGQKVKDWVEPRTQALTRERDTWQSRYAELADIRMKAETLKAQYQPPIPAWFMSYLANVVPQDLILTHVAVRQTEGRWVVEMKGQGSEDFTLRAEQLTRLEQELTAGPFHMVMTKSWKDTWLESLRRGVRFGDKLENRVFALEGMIG
jgi:hypothetical protein